MCLWGTLRVTNDLCDAVAVADIDKDKPTVVVPSIYPTGQGNDLTYIRCI